MSTAIPPTALIRRPGAQRWHIQSGALYGDRHEFGKTVCGMAFRVGAYTTAYNSRDIDCEACLIGAIRLRAEKAAR